MGFLVDRDASQDYHSRSADTTLAKHITSRTARVIDTVSKKASDHAPRSAGRFQTLAFSVGGLIHGENWCDVGAGKGPLGRVNVEVDLVYRVDMELDSTRPRRFFAT